MYPRVDIHAQGVLRNFEAIRTLTSDHGIDVCWVTKALAGYQPLVERLIDAGADSIGEAHIHTIQKYGGLPARRWMIRLPLPSQAAEVVRHTEVSVNTEVSTVRALGQAGLDQGKTHRVVIMVESGDRREGVMGEDALRVCAEVARTPGVELYGVGTEFGCVSDVVPSRAALDDFAQVTAQIESRLGMRLPVVSGGSSNGLGLLAAGEVPTAINHMRIGEALLTGRTANFNDPLPGGFLSPFTLSAEIVEVQVKPSMPAGVRAPMEVPVAQDPRFTDRGMRTRALVAVGKQDVGVHHLIPLDPGVIIEEGSSDVFVADITDCEQQYRPGDILTFSMGYFAILPAMVSEFVEKRLV